MMICSADARRWQATWKLMGSTHEGRPLHDVDWVGDGNRYAFGMSGRDYPAGFDAQRGSRRTIYEFARQRP
jgi:hypothetical protein